MNISMGKVNDVIKIVLEKLAKKKLQRMPSVGTKCRLMGEALVLAQIQVTEAI